MAFAPPAVAGGTGNYPLRIPAMATAHDSSRLNHPASLAQTLETQRRAFAADPYPSLSVRRDRLARLAHMLREHSAGIRDAISADFGQRAGEETELLEVFTSLEGIAHARRKLRRWMRTERRRASWWSLPGRAAILRQPLRRPNDPLSGSVLGFNKAAALDVSYAEFLANVGL